MTTLAQRISETVFAGGPGALCFACLAARHGSSEHDVRAAALVLVCRAGFDLAYRTCSSCRRVEEALVPRTAA